MWSSAKAKWRAFCQLAWRDRLLVMQAALAIPLVAIGLRVLGFRQLQKCLAGRRSRVLPVPTADVSERQARARTVARIVLAVGSTWPFRVACLSRSVTLWWLLRRQGIDSQLRIGVRKQAQGIEAHAWVELEGVVVSETGDLWREYSPFDQAVPPPECTP